MTTYRVATGHNVALGSLNVLAPQPKSTGIQVARRTHVASGAVYDDAEYVILEYSALEDETAYQALLTSLGLASATTANVTVYVRNQRWTWARKNGVAVLPEQGRDVRWDNYFARNISILVRDLEDPT